MCIKFQVFKLNIHWDIDKKNWIPCRMKAVFTAKVLGWICSPLTHLAYPRAWLGIGLRSYFIFCEVTPILSMRSPLWKNVSKGEISKNAKIDNANLLITPLFLNRFSKSFFPLKAEMFSFPRHVVYPLCLF